jgi:hypothetical protein
MLTACGTGFAADGNSRAAVPAAIILTPREQEIMKNALPDLYVPFTAQQVQLLRARGEAAP